MSAEVKATLLEYRQVFKCHIHDMPGKCKELNCLSFLHGREASLSLPIKGVHRHPFELGNTDELHLSVFFLS